MQSFLIKHHAPFISTYLFRLEKDNLRTTNTELMDRLKKIWTSYKEVLPSTSHHYSSDSDQINDKVIYK